ncbi:hypothetical protein BDFB_002666 [Asbolus verrucosus]|uniref:Uncharacterized protein n=1 Tax=Asbolus verrucosus TaxID=1661398 RepID=A0A482VHU9_ASBVE|nr:hypothetical protein BDFB_002666 [Asbolus verrucosus]
MSCDKVGIRASSVQIVGAPSDFRTYGSPLAWASGLAIRENEPWLDRIRSWDPIGAVGVRTVHDVPRRGPAWIWFGRKKAKL